MEWYIEALSKYADFSGRSRRREYWYFHLFNLIISIILFGMCVSLVNVTGIAVLGFLYFLYSLFIFIPSLALIVRRLHDTGRSGWWFLIFLVPIIGAIILLIFTVTDSNEGDNKYGASPKLY